jgi:S-DNA-T family DNA segregation ATPase FtsK/SpoIIIE
MGGAEKLLGSGDMLYMTGELPKPIRLQSPFISRDEIKKVVSYLTNKHRDDVFDTINVDDIVVRSDPANSTGMESGEEDSLVEEAREEVIRSKKASTSYLQRKLGIGYSRAAKLIDILEEQGVIGPANGSKPRDVLVGPEAEGFEIGDESEMEEAENSPDFAENGNEPDETIDEFESRGDKMTL